MPAFRPHLAHPLSPAPHFVGRHDELRLLHDVWRGGFRGVLALVGLGGAGKTAVAARFLGDLLADTPPRGLFVWSFYQEPDAGLFLREATHYFGGAAPGPAKGAGLLHLLRDALETGGPHLLVLDGLERVQRPDGAGYGQIEDVLLRGLLTRLAEGTGRAAALVTSRFPLADLEAYRAAGYRQVDVGGLSSEAAVALLRQRGVLGDDAALARLVGHYGAHALTLDHLGGLLGTFLGGDPSRAPEVPALTDPTADRQALRLARLLRAYEQHLPPEELALLCRLCLLRRSVTGDQVARLFLCSPAVHARTVREIPKEVLRHPEAEDWNRDFLEDMAEAARDIVERALCAAPVAGPEDVFREEVRQAAATVLERQGETIGVEVEELARLYARADLDVPTDRLPLAAADRAALRELIARYVELSRHPLLPHGEPAGGLEVAFKSLGWPKTQRLAGDDRSPADVFKAFVLVKARLRRLTYLHFLLRRVRELCRAYQRKWSLAGPLAPLGAAELGRTLNALVARHLVLREADGALSVHPAVRDHFGRLATDAERGEWHDLLREQMISLARRPGRDLPADARTLDLVEEAVHHALAVGRRDDAARLYEHGLGGLRHLGWKLGEFQRGVRVLRQFDPCPDRWALGWFLRSLGELDEAYAHTAVPYFRADVRLLQGRLPAVAAEGDVTRAAVAAFLTGDTRDLPPQVLGAAVPRVQVLTYLGEYDRAWRSVSLEQFYGDVGWDGERARCQLLLAELARRQGDVARCADYFVAATEWVLHAGSVEHLCLFHLVRSRVARTKSLGRAAQSVVTEGLHLARQCGLGLYLIELLCEQAEVCLARDDPKAADWAAAALERASAADCRFAWGEAEAGHLVGRALLARGERQEARRFLEAALELRERLGDPRAADTERLLRSEGGGKDYFPKV